MFSNWEQCHAQVNGFKGACFKGYKSKTDAFDAFLSYDKSIPFLRESNKLMCFMDVVIVIQFIIIFILICIMDM